MSGYLGVGTRALRFDVDERGRPLLEAPRTDVQFSIAHSRAVGVAVRRGGRIGLDVEAISGVRGPIERYRAAFSASEWATIDASGHPSRALLQIWTRKEALLKALGTGLRTPLAHVLGDRATLENVVEVRPTADLDPSRRTWLIWDLDGIEGLVGACATTLESHDMAGPSVHVIGRHVA